MTKIKKRLALMMALVMAMTTLILPASAANVEDEVVPCAVTRFCSTCGGDVTQRRLLVATRKVDVSSCNKSSSEHDHTLNTYDVYDTCVNCGTTYCYTTTLTTCNAN